MGQSIFEKLSSRLEIIRLEQRYTKRRNRRSTFVSEATYVDGEYVYNTPSGTPSATPNTPSSTGSSTSSKTSVGSYFPSVSIGRGGAKRQSMFLTQRGEPEAPALRPVDDIREAENVGHSKASWRDSLKSKIGSRTAAASRPVDNRQSMVHDVRWSEDAERRNRAD